MMRYGHVTALPGQQNPDFWVALEALAKEQMHRKIDACCTNKVQKSSKTLAPI